jgi:exodeoxyribonuclease-3
VERRLAHSALLKDDGFATGVISRFPLSHVARIREGFHHGLLRCRVEGMWISVIHFHPSNYAHRIAKSCGAC